MPNAESSIEDGVVFAEGLRLLNVRASQSAGTSKGSTKSRTAPTRPLECIERGHVVHRPEDFAKREAEDAYALDPTRVTGHGLRDSPFPLVTR